MRIQGWEKAVEDYIQETAKKKFEWGVCDCLIFVSDAVQIICGKDPMSAALEDDPDTIRGKYSTEKEAYKLIVQHRGTIFNIMDVHFKTVDPAFAQRGDVVLQLVNGNMTFGLVWSKGASVFKTLEEGIVMQKAKDAAQVWRVE